MFRAHVELLDELGYHHRRVTMAEAERQEEAGNWYRVSKRKAKRVQYRMKFYPKPSQSGISPVNITFADVLANVGITNGEGPASYGRVKAAQNKITEWGAIHLRESGVACAIASA